MGKNLCIGFTLECLLRKRLSYSEPVYSVIARLLETSNANEVHAYRQVQEKRSMPIDIIVCVPRALHGKLKILCKENKIKMDQLIWRLIENELTHCEIT